MIKNKNSNENGFAHLSLIIIIVLSIAVVGLAGYRVNEMRNADRARSAQESEKAKELAANSSKLSEEDTVDEAVEEKTNDKPVDQPKKEETKPTSEKPKVEDKKKQETETKKPREILFVKGGGGLDEGNVVDFAHIMQEAHTGTCTFKFSLNGTVRVKKTTHINNSKSCHLVVPVSEFPKSADYTVNVKFVSDDGSVYAELDPYEMLVM